MFNNPMPKYKDSREACVDVWDSLSALEKWWPFRIFWKMKSRLFTLRDAVLFVRDDLSQMRAQVAQWEQSQKDILSSMDKVRDRNRRLERNMYQLGLSNAQVNGEIIRDDAYWKKAVYLFGRNLETAFQEHEFQYGLHGRPNIQVMASFGDDMVMQVARIVQGAMEMQRGHYPEDANGNPITYGEDK